ncbi:hydroxyethylthiazole kinase [Rhodovulum imhoffii]|uniref:Hydroxyethylthiazole kinase n=1 Tax=Rhodovulum imhoffii TaxID=365340 RepID=A0A2T5BNV0_9RHOB|nr:hydroxyethylthiazole kinase [Rhodovulum imhoffii]MBK5932547.1 hydroxyethylthiazole kinase [Rhodovulum imhoffii]PTN00688.1 hydroxyethylthiazole kinase [Rhodovulum imhoffii]
MEQPGYYLATLRANAPLMQNITNKVAQNIAANVQLAAGASPAMVDNRAESAPFAQLADALSINIGTPDPETAGAMMDAAQVMNDRGCPWVLDPVGVGITGYRRDLAARLVALRPTVIRGNASEILTLVGAEAAASGVDSGDTVEAAEGAARELALRTGKVVAVTGPVDHVTDGTRAILVENGHPLMPKVTALGCALSALVAAFLVRQPPLEATVAALAYYGLAGERAGAGAAGPGSFQVRFLDALHAITPEDLNAGAKVRA